MLLRFYAKAQADQSLCFPPKTLWILCFPENALRRLIRLRGCDADLSLRRACIQNTHVENAVSGFMFISLYEVICTQVK